MTMTADCDFDYAQFLLEHYGMLLSVEDLARLFKYPSAEAVRRAHYSGRLPVKLRSFPDRRGLFVTALEVADVMRSFEKSGVQLEDPA